MSDFNPENPKPQIDDREVVSLRKIALFLYQLVTGSAQLPATPKTLTQSTPNANGHVNAGAVYIEFILSEDFAGTIGGMVFSGANDTLYALPYLNGGTYPQVNYTITAGSARLTTIA